ncbi:hypothetical protein CR513_29747, partial [Mucuna pruriens]
MKVQPIFSCYDFDEQKKVRVVILEFSGLEAWNDNDQSDQENKRNHDGDGSGVHDDINKTIGRVREGNMIYPNIRGSKYGDGVVVTHYPQPKVGVGVLNHATIFGYNFLDANSMDDDIAHVLHGEATAILDLHIRTMTLNGLVRGNQKLLPQLNYHVTLEYNP